MKKRKVLGIIICCGCLTVRADIAQTVDQVWSYLSPSDPLNSAIDKFRLAVKAFYSAAKVTGYKKGGYQALQDQFLYPPTGTVPDAVRERLAEYANRVVSSTKSNALLRHNAELGAQEQAFIERRLDHVGYAFRVTKPEAGNSSSEVLSSQEMDAPVAFEVPLLPGIEVPRIAVCASGGGFRAMIGTLGFWKAMVDTGMVDYILYSANLSGSTWSSMPWCMGASLAELEACYTKYATSKNDELLKSVLSRYISASAQNKLTTAFLWDQPLSSVRGLYAPLLGELIFSCWDDDQIRAAMGTLMPKQSSQYLYLWQALDFIKDGTKRPFPIATGLVPFQAHFASSLSKLGEQQRSAHGIWIEYNPEEVGFDYFTSGGQLTGAWIPSYAFGRKIVKEVKKEGGFLGFFSKKVVTSYDAQPGPSQTLDYWAGTWGSAFAVSFQDIYRIFTGKNVAEKDEKSPSSIGLRLLNYVVDAASLDPRNASFTQASQARFFPAKYNNFALFDDSPFKDCELLSVVDAGIDFNLPFPPLLRSARKVDLIIAVDFSSGEMAAKQLLLAEKWARTRGLPFPLIKTSKQLASVSNQPMTLFNEYPAGVQGPAILYLPLQDNQFNAPDFSVAECMKNECATFNFKYDGTVKKLSDHMYRTVMGVRSQMHDFIQALVKAKNEGHALTTTELSALK